MQKAANSDGFETHRYFHVLFHYVTLNLNLLSVDRLSFDVFIPAKKKFRLTPNWIVYILWIVVIAFLWIFDDYFPPHSQFRSIVLGCVIVVNIYYLITSFFKYEPLNGILKGKIIFNNDAIIVNERVYELKNISGIDFGFINFYGERSTSYHGNFNPLISQGVSNFITFTDSNKQSIRVYFRIQGKHGSQALYSFINEAVKCGAMTYYRAIDLIDVENVRKPATS